MDGRHALARQCVDVGGVPRLGADDQVGGNVVEVQACGTGGAEGWRVPTSESFRALRPALHTTPLRTT